MSPRKKASGRAFTVEFPQPLPAEKRGDAWWMDAEGRELRLSNLDKVFWPDEGYTKGDLVAYYYNVAELILPHLRERPLTMKRMPDGISGPFFYEKTAPSHTPDWIPRCPVRSDESKDGVIGYLMVNDLATLLFVANLGCIEMHPLHSRCSTIETPDYLFFDLDPMGASFEDVLIVARHVRAALGALGLTGYPKTSGATGVQIYVPVERGWSYDQVRDFVGTLGRTIERADREHVTMAWQIDKRTGKVFIDHNMNRSGANISAVYSLRPEAGATVSTPLLWEEVDAGVTPQDFRIDNVWERFEKLGDLFEGVRTSPQELGTALEAVGLSPEKAVEPRGSTRRTSEEVIAASKDPDLGEYLRKRTFGPEGTTEPAPSGTAGEGNSFVIHKHRATRLHYDVRLERDGALPSWAVPRGLPTKPGDKRLAVRTEDHPLEYGSFEGSIPEGHYGAGEVRIFDDGWYEPVEWTDSKVSFRLHGRRYPGLEFHFVKTRTDWLAFLASNQQAPLIASPPAFQPMLAEGGWKAFDDPSVVVRAEVRRDPLDDHDGHRRHTPGHEERTGRLRQVPGAPDDPRARGPGERGLGRRDRGVRRGREELVRGAPTADEPVQRARDQADLEQDPGRVGRLRPAVARRSRSDRPRAGATAGAAGDDRRAGPPAPGRDPRRRRRHRRSPRSPRGSASRVWSPNARARNTNPDAARRTGARSSSPTPRTA
ncbi:MAG: hypothetical protein EHM22_04950 [Actinobacteria bacterium]|nr:MAG: hypothetical protein EHM22_04950 [Actinomycetota bacterium]